MAVSGTQTTRFRASAACVGIVLVITAKSPGVPVDVDGSIGGQALLVETARPGAMFVGGTTGSQALPVETARPNAKLEDT